MAAISSAPSLNSEADAEAGTGADVEPLPSDRTLLGLWRNAGRSEAFTELVRRHFQLVRGIARRQLGEDLAEDAAQNVFTILARKAPDARCLSAWLHRVTVLHCRDAVRRKLREQRARHAAMEMITLSEARDPLADALPHIDSAIASMEDRDRELLLLRYSEGLSFTAAASRTGRTEAALRKQTERALEKLSLLLKRRGVSVPSLALASGLGGVLGSPPTAHALSVAAAAMAGAGTAAGFSLFSLTLAFATMTTTQSLAAGAATAALLSAIPLGWQSWRLQHPPPSAAGITSPAGADLTENENLPSPEDPGKPTGSSSEKALTSSSPTGDPMKELSDAMEAEAKKVILDWARSSAWTESRRLAMVLGLSPEREKALLVALTKLKDARVDADMAIGGSGSEQGKARRQFNQQRGAWLNENLSAEELVRLRTHDLAQKEALIAAKAEEALHQISSAVELSDDQKTKLFNAGAAKVGQDLEKDEYLGRAQFTGTFQSATPLPVEESSAEMVRKVLDPAQQQLWEENVDRQKYTEEDMPRRLVDRAFQIIQERGMLGQLAAMMGQMPPPSPSEPQTKTKTESAPASGPTTPAAQ